MDKFLEVTESTLGLSWDENKIPYHYRTNHKALIIIDDIIEVIDNYNEDINIDDIHVCCSIVLDKSKYGDNNCIDVLDRFTTLKKRLNYNEY